MEMQFMPVSSFAIMERLIAGHQTHLSRPSVPRISVPNRVYLPVLETSFAFENLLREMGGVRWAAVLRAIQILQRWAPLSIWSSHEPPMSE